MTVQKKLDLMNGFRGPNRSWLAGGVGSIVLVGGLLAPVAAVPAQGVSPALPNVRSASSVAAHRAAPPPIITFAGLGRAQIGLSMDRFAAALRWPLRLDQSSGAQSPCWLSKLGPDAAGVWVLTSRGRRGGVDRVSVETQMGKQVDVRRAPRTAKGIGLGSSARQVLSAYRGAVTSSQHTYVPGGHYLDVRGSRGLAMRFETDGRGRVVAIHAGRADRVKWIEHCS